MLGVDVDRFLNHQVVFFGLGDLLDDAVGALQHSLQLFVFAQVQIFLKFALFALKVAVLLNQLALALHALRLGQGGCLALKLFRGALELGGQGLHFFFAARKLLFQFGLCGLGEIGFAKNSVGVHEPDAKLLGRRRQGRKPKGRSEKNMAVEQAREGLH